MAILSQNFVFFQRLSHLMELFPASFNEKLCEQLLVSFISGFSVTFYITGEAQAQQTAARVLLGSRRKWL